MASDSEKGEKTEEATPQRREDFRKRGQVAQTKELSAAFFLFTSIILIWMLSRYYFSQIFELFQFTMGSQLASTVREGALLEALQFAMLKSFILVGPALLVLGFMALAAQLLQVGFLYNEEALQFKPERLDPIQGLKRIFSLRNLMEGIKSILKVSVILVITYFVLRAQIYEIPHLVEYSMAQLFEFIGVLLIKVLGGVGAFMLVLSAGDYLFQNWSLEQEMMMTKQEVKEELKSREGDPLIKARIKRVQRELARKRMMDDVPKADVIVTNPTHIAVALKYDETMVAPKVLAKGADLIAQKIKSVASEHGIPLVENKPLARVMYKTLKIGQTIPKELYAAVAEVLSYVYRLRRKGGR